MILTKIPNIWSSNECHRRSKNQDPPDVEETRERRQTQTTRRRAALGAIGAAAAAVAAASRRITDQPVIDNINRHNDDEHESELRGHTDRDDRPVSITHGMFRSDIRENRQGTTLTLTIKVVNVNSACAAVSGADVEIWHVDAAGDYSQYGSQTAATFLRGIQTTNAAGEVTFTTIYPGWYQGRATHIHAEVTMGGRSMKVTQMAFPETINNAVHTSGVYASRGTNPMSNQSDGIFSDSLVI